MRKICTVCKGLKSTSCFYLDRRANDGFYSICKDCHNSITKAWRANNPDKTKEITKRWAIQNPERKRFLNRTWKETHPSEVREHRRRSNNKVRSSLKGTLNHRISVAMNTSLKKSKKGRHWESLVGYTVGQLKRHLEKTFTPGMSWQLFMEGKIHIDHDIPISAFNFDTPDHPDFKRCWAIENLKPLWASENISKKNRLQKPFQPFLKLQ